MKHILFDSDVVLDVLANRDPFVEASTKALNQATQPDIKGYISGHAVTNVFYILRRKVGSPTARTLISQLLMHLQIANITDDVIKAALRSPINDFEDAVTSEAAKVMDVEIIVTRNKSDFAASTVPALLPEEFLNWN